MRLADFLASCDAMRERARTTGLTVHDLDRLDQCVRAYRLAGRPSTGPLATALDATEAVLDTMLLRDVERQVECRQLEGELAQFTRSIHRHAKQRRAWIRAAHGADAA